MIYETHGYGLEFKKIDEIEWRSLLNDEMGLCYKTRDGAIEGMRRLKEIYDEKLYCYRIFPIFVTRDSITPKSSPYVMDEESQII